MLDIGNARIAGLQDELKLSGRQYEWLLEAFYITYIVFEWMTLMQVHLLVAVQNISNTCTDFPGIALSHRTYTSLPAYFPGASSHHSSLSPLLSDFYSF